VKLRAMQQQTPDTLITGALGSGKTALLKRMLKTSNRRLGVLMNEFGEIAIDCEL
jgi:cobalamin biosynthesis protein CobW